jgi:8-oxo-dGTP pyrophosphatase MutT (NUDIX family)
MRSARFIPGPMREVVVRATSPRYTVGAMVRIDREDGYVLLVKPAYRRQWTLPGGVAGKNENPLEVMQRELWEEAGVRCDVVGEPLVMVSAADRIVDFVYYAKLSDGFSPDDARPSAYEIEAVGWFPLEDVPRLAGVFAEKIIAGTSTAGQAARLIFTDDLPR